MNYYNKCYIIMPFSETTSDHNETYWDNHYYNLLKPSIESNIKILVERSEPMRTGLLQDIIRNLIFSKVVVADITDTNANVLWELGVRQSFTNGTVIIADENIQTRIPFDLSIKGILFYPSFGSVEYIRKMDDFKKKLILAIQDCLNNPDIYDSYVLEIIKGRNSIYQIIIHDENLRKLTALINEMESNLNTLYACRDSLKQNTYCKMGQVYSYCTNRLRGNSVKLLLTTRYLAEDENFYLEFEEYSEGIHKINGQLDLWTNNRQTAESWLSDTLILAIPTLEKLVKKIKDAQIKIENQL